MSMISMVPLAPMRRFKTPAPPAGKLEVFAEAIRGKKNWHVKILDEERGLAEKWAKEAALTEKGVEQEQVDLLIRELKREAQRILSLDPVLYTPQPAPTDQSDWKLIDADVSLARTRIKEFKYALREPTLKEHVGVLTADDLIPPSLHAVLESELDELAGREVKDFHPGSDGKVQDLIHPSLYPYVHGVTRILDPEHPLNNVEKFETKTDYPVDEYGDQSTEHSSMYAWIPSLFSISEDGKVSIDSAINALGPRSEHPALYSALERVFELSLPQIEESMFHRWVYEQSPSYRRWQARSKERQGRNIKAWREKIEEQKGEKEVEIAWKKREEERVREEMTKEEHGVALGGRQESRLAGKTLKVIVKAVNYVLRPGEEYEGSWHVEGAPHEHIRASLIYYYSCSPSISDEGLSFRRLRTDADEPNMAREHGDDFGIWDKDAEDDDDGGWKMDYPSDVEDPEPGYPYELPRNIVLGTVPATGVDGAEGKGTGRLLSFPNWLQHQVAGLRNTETEGKESAVRKILCFFVVNEDYPEADEQGHLDFPGFYHSGAFVGPSAPPIPTTAELLPQPRFRIFPYVYNALDMACNRATGGMGLPVELAMEICEMAQVGMTRSDAERHRRLLMDDRRAAGKEVNDAWEEQYGLCEH